MNSLRRVAGWGLWALLGTLPACGRTNLLDGGVVTTSVDPTLLCPPDDAGAPQDSSVPVEEAAPPPPAMDATSDRTEGVRDAARPDAPPPLPDGTSPACTGGLLSAAEDPLASQPVSIVAGDLNGDNNADIVAFDTDGDMVVVLGVADGGTRLLSTPGPGPAADVYLGAAAIGDLNGDGKGDLAVVENSSATSNIRVLLGNGDGTMGPPHTFPTTNGPAAVAIADLNGDHVPDLALGGFNGVSTLLGKGDGTFGSARTLTTTSTGLMLEGTSITTGDWNGDGHTDLATIAYADQVAYVMLGDGSGTYTQAVGYAVGMVPRWIASGDFNGDGAPDLAVTNSESYSVSILMGLGDGTFAQQVVHPISANPWSVVVDDTNGDGRLDLVVGTQGSEVDTKASTRLYVLLGRGDGSFDEALTYSAGGSPQYAAVGDFNGDGALDMASANVGGPSVSVLLMSQCGGAPGQPLPTACVNGAPCMGTVSLTCADPNWVTCTLGCDCAQGGRIYCQEGCQ